MVKSKVFIFRKHFDGLPKPGDLELVEEELPPLKDGECLVEAVYLSVDPYMRAHAPNLRLDTPFIGSQVAIIKESKNSKFPVGKYITGMFGWRTHSIVSDATIGWPSMPTYVLPDFGKLPISLALGALGTPGNTAYLGFLEICQPKSGETVVVSGAAGAVGNQVGQIAKIKGCKVIGIAGSDEKGKWLVDDLKFDHFINYKTQNVDEALKELAPEGIDCYFDNVGGEISTIVLNNMNAYGRVSVCGSISGYNDRSTKASIVQFAMVGKQLKMEGFITGRWKDKMLDAFRKNLEWINEGKLKYKETVTEGFENMFTAFAEMLQGANIGKAVVKA